jgi:hypothetical protein
MEGAKEIATLSQSNYLKFDYIFIEKENNIYDTT